MRQKLKRSFPAFIRTARTIFHHLFLDTLKGFVLAYFPCRGTVLEISFEHWSPFGEQGKRFKAISIGFETVDLDGTRAGVEATQYLLRSTLLPYDYRGMTLYWHLSDDRCRVIRLMKLDGFYQEVSVAILRRGKKRATVQKVRRSVPTPETTVERLAA